MNKLIIAAAATLIVSTTQLTAPAQAGGGVRLGFGFPLGSFTARPTSQPYHAPSHGYRAHKAPKVHAAPKHVEKKVVVAKPKKWEQAEEAPRAAKVKKVTKSARVASRKVETVEKTEDPGQGGTVTAALTAAAVTAETTPTPVTAAPAPAPVKEIATVELPPAKVEAPAPAVEVEQPAPAPVPVVEKVEAPVEAAPAPKKTAKKGFDCRKFIPSVGVTISVKCSQ